MISEKFIMEKVKEYAASPSGRKAIKEKHGIDYMLVDGKVAAARMSAVALKARQILFRHISEVIGSINIDDIIIGEPVIKKDGTVQIMLSFREDALARQSLQPNKYPRGIEDIVLHFSRGWNAKGAVFGSWHGSNTWSRRAKASDRFLFDAVEEINLQVKGMATAELKGEYKE